MSATTRATSRTLRLSVWLYRHLLIAYPRPFRREYGAQMVQVFRDCCREAAHANGAVGLLRYWLIAFGDLIVSALAERHREELHMTRTLWIRLGSLAAIIASIGPVVLFMLSLTILLVNLLAPQAPLSLDLPVGVGWVVTSQRVLYVLVLVALWIRGANRTGVFGETTIALALAGAIIAGVGGILFMSAKYYDASQLGLYSNIMSIGSAILAVGMLFYGVLILKHRHLPRLTWVPLAVGLTELLNVVTPFIGAYFFPQGSDAYLLKFATLVYATNFAVTVAWILLGIALWPRRSEQAATRDVPASIEPAV